MDPKPVNPDKKAVKPLKALDETIKKAKKANIDTKALKAAGQGLAAADKTLEFAMGQAYLALVQAGLVAVAVFPSGPGPVPIPYPNIAKARKSTDAAIKKLRKAHREQEKASTKMVKILDQEVATLKSKATMSSGDEAGVLKGLISAKNMAKVKPKFAAGHVKAQGKKVTRFWAAVDKQVKKVEKQQKGK